MPVIVTFEDDGVGDVLLLQFAFLDETEFLFTDAFQKFRCIVAEISDNLAGNKRMIVLIISALK